MTPFQSLRLWARRAPAAERAAAVVAAGLLAALTWTVVPGHRAAGSLVATSGPGGLAAPGGSQPGSAAGSQLASGGGGVASGGAQLPGSQPAPSSAGAGSAGGAAGSALAGAQVGTGSGSGPAQGGSPAGPTDQAPGCAGLPVSGPGVTARQIRIAVTLTTIVGPAANSTFGLPAPSEQQADYQQVIDSINRSGGVACRQLVPQYYTVNAADQSDQQQKCLDIAQSGVFAELDFTAYSTVGGSCFAQHHVPFFIDYFLPGAETTQFYPYLFALNTYDSLYHNAMFALKERGFFSPADGFKKLGYIYRDCFPQVVTHTLGWLQQAGVPASAIVRYDVGCPAAFATPNDLEQAILKFQQAGVTNVTTTYFLGDFPNFTDLAEQQGFRPKYGIGDDGTINISYGSQHPNYANVKDAIAVTASRYGEERTPGMTPTAGTSRCNAIYQSQGRPPVYTQPVGAGGLVCDELWMFAAAAGHAPALAPGALAAGLHAVRSVDFSYPEGPNDFSAGPVTTGGQYWRVDQFQEACACWRVIDPQFHPSF